MENKKVVIAVVLCIGAFISLLYGITSEPRKRQTGASVSESGKDKTAPPAVRIVPAKRRAARTEFVSWGRNPFSPRETTVSGKFTLGGVVWDEKEPRALINNAILGIGDTIEGAVVVDIKQESVILNDGIRDFELRMQ